MTLLLKRSSRRRLYALLAGVLVLIALVIAQRGIGVRVAEHLRERSFAFMGSLFPRPAPATRPVLVVDIDRQTLARFGPWPWPRDRLARLVSAIAAAKPVVLGLDMILVDRDGPEADAPLREALTKVPSILGSALDPEFSDELRLQPLTIAVLGNADTSQLPAAQGLVTSPQHLVDVAQGVALVSFLGGELGGRAILSAPLIVSANGQPIAGMPLALGKVYSGAAAVIIDGRAREMRVGQMSLPLAPDLSLRLHHGRAEERSARTISATRLFEGGEVSAFEGKIVLLGTSAPEIGGLRPTAVDQLMPSTQILADATEQLLQSYAPIRLRFAPLIEIAAATAIALLGSFAVLSLSPVIAAGIVAGLVALWAATALLAFLVHAWLLDPIVPILVGIIPIQATALMLFSITLRERRTIERRFAQHLPPEVVARIAEAPERIRIDGETREITALFTDIEGFTAMTERASPRELIALLDSYVETVAGIVTMNGGMVDKIVGDAVHAFFNAPLDCEAHPAKALKAAVAIITATDALRAGSLGMRLQLGRTRIGIETGRAILGDVGGGRKLDYTAHGPAINAAAKLEAANKQYGTSILIGPGAAAKLGVAGLREVGLWQATPSSLPATIYTLSDLRRDIPPGSAQQGPEGLGARGAP